MINDSKTDENITDDMINVHNIHYRNIPDQRPHDGILPGERLGPPDAVTLGYAGCE